MGTRFRFFLVLFAALALLATACGDDDSDSEVSDTTEASDTTEETDETDDTEGDEPDSVDGPAIVVGAQDFGESIVLAHVYSQALANAGYDASVQEVSGFRDILFGAFDAGDVNLTAEYVASLLEFLNGPDKTEATSDVDESADLLDGYLADEGLVAYEPAPGVDTNAFVITQETSDELGITTLSDLAEKGGDLSLGAPSDCETNAFCLPGLERVYGIDFSDRFVPLDDGRPDALESGQIDVAVIFSTDGIIAERGFVLLEDDMKLLAADNIVPIASQEIADAYGQALAEVLNAVSAELDTETLIGFNQAFDIEARDADEIAEEWIEENGF